MRSDFRRFVASNFQPNYSHVVFYPCELSSIPRAINRFGNGRSVRRVYCGCSCTSAGVRPGSSTRHSDARRGETRNGLGRPPTGGGGRDCCAQGWCTAIDAVIATSLALGVAEPYGSGLGGKLNLVYYDAATKKTYAVDGLDQASWSLDAEAYRKLPEAKHRAGWSSVGVPGLAAGLWVAHQKWGARPWAEDIGPAIKLAREGFRVLPKTRDFFQEQEKKLRAGDPEIARLYLPGGKLPVPGTLLANEDLARTMELLAAKGPDGFYKGPVAAAMVEAAKKGGGFLTIEDFARYEARVSTPVAGEVFGFHIEGGPPPSTGVALYLPILKALETETWASGPLRTAANLDKLGRVWQQVQPAVSAGVADVPTAGAAVAKLLSDDFIREVRRKAGVGGGKALTSLEQAGVGWDVAEAEPAFASTTHFVVVDAKGNVASVTQSTSLHFGAGVIAPGAGVVMNDTMSYFAFNNPKSVNIVAPGKRARSTTSPSIVFQDGRPVLAIGIPGAQRIPIAMLQVLLDHLAFHRPLAEAIGDTRLHLLTPESSKETANVWEVESSLPESEVKALVALGWRVEKMEAPGTGRHFGGFNAIAIAPDGTLTGFADPRRTNAAVGY